MICRVFRGASVRLQLPGDDQGRRGADRGAQGQRHSSQETSRRAGPREVPVLPAHHHTAGTLSHYVLNSFIRIYIQAEYAQVLCSRDNTTWWTSSPTRGSNPSDSRNCYRVQSYSYFYPTPYFVILTLTF